MPYHIRDPKRDPNFDNHTCVFLFLSVKLFDSAVSDFRFGSHAKWPCIYVASQIDSFWFRV